MADKSRLTRSRGVYRGQITKLQNRVQEVFAHDTLSEDDQDSLHSILFSFQEKMSFVTDIDKQLTVTQADEELETFLTETDDYNTQVKECFMTYERKLKRRLLPVITSDNNPTNPSQTNPSRRHVNLPKLTLKQFDGDILQWTEFYDAFKSAIDSDSGLTNVQKFHYLQAQVTGEAARVISGLSLTDSNYIHAIDLLKKRYGQTHQIIHAYMRALWELRKPDYTSDSLRDFYDRLESYIRGLSTLGKKIDSYGDLLVPVILDKLPSSLRKQIARDHDDCEWTIDDLKSSLLREIKALQAGDVSSVSDDNRLYATAAFYTPASHRSNKPQRVKPSRKCAFCKGDHASNDCIVISDKRKRNDIVVREKLCYNCLGKHRAADCKSRFRCLTCNRKHHTALCNESKVSCVTASNTAPNNRPTERSISNSETTVSLATSNGPVLLKTAVAKVSAGRNETTVAVLFDEGAQRSFITQEAVNLLNLNCEESENIHLSTFGQHSDMKSLQVANFKLHIKSQSETLAIRALVVPRISTPMRNYVDSSVVNLPHIRGLKLAHPCAGSNEDITISVLIGADYYWSIVEDLVIRGPGPTAVSSKLGYLLSGPTGQSTRKHQGRQMSVHHVNVDTHGEEMFDLQRFWDLESIGIRNQELESLSNHTQYHESYIRKEQNRYIAKLPWKHDHDPLPTNRELTEKRTRAMVRRLKPDIREAYDNVLKEQLSRDYIDLVQDDDPTTGHYLPHRAVRKESSSTPLRIVYDCSASQNDRPCLNDCLQTGPPLLNDLTSILLRFRIHRVAFTADIQKAFLQIGLDSDDRKYTKFFWLRDHRDPESDFLTYEFNAILFGAVCSPFILNSTVRTHLESQPSDVTQDLISNIYVDNIVTGCDNELSAIQYYDETNEIMNSGGFQLQQWSTNSSDLMEYITPDELMEGNSDVNVLGLQWDTKCDQMSFRDVITSINSQDTVTKRIVLQTVAKLFDPLGFLAPIQVRAKIFIQKLWKAGYGWDEAISDELMQEWNDIVSDLSDATATAINRRYFCSDYSQMATYELHAFADSSKSAYGCVIYLRDVQNERTAFVMAKSRVAPIKELTIPKLELLAVQIASNLLSFVYNSIEKELAITKRIVWTDSQIAIHWLNSDKKLPVFVTNRVKAIKSHSIDDFRYCPTHDNPADMVSRGVSFHVLSASSMWWNGPAWLPDGDWPVCRLFDNNILSVCADLDPPTNQNATVSKSVQPCVINTQDFSSRARLHRITAYVFRFIRSLRDKQRANLSKLSVTEINDAERFWIMRVQQQHYNREIEALRRDDGDVKTRIPLVKQLRLFLDDKGFLRVGGRLHNAPLKYDTRFPILLPHDDHYTRLLICDAHRHSAHGGTETTLTYLRQNYWITRMRITVRSVLRKCVPCKKLAGLPYRLPDTAPLQSCRLLESPPFTVCGLDFTGALYVKSNSGGRQGDKVYILLFTCASTRAIHLELVPNLSVYSFLLAFRRFVARRSLPIKLISDNASTFLAADNELKKLFRSNELTDFMLNHRIEWINITQRAPWQGGFWERLIGVTKASLKRVVGKAFLSYHELATIITEVESAINNRPLTYFSADANDLSPLTPNHLLHGRMITNLPHAMVSDDEDVNDLTFVIGNSQIELEKRSRHLAKLLTHFWQRWKNEYVTSLRERHIHSNHNPRTTSELIKVGDVVLVHEDKSRMNWKLAVVIKLIAGNDHKIRSAQLRTKNGITNRPINKLYPLEVSSETEINSGQNHDGLEISRILDNGPNDAISGRPSPRNAALVAKESIRLISMDN